MLFLFIGCATTNKPAYHTKMGDEAVYLDPHNSWSNDCPVNVIPSRGQCYSPWRSITIRAINKKYRDVDIRVVCSYDNNAKFGEKIVTVKARNDKMFTIWGLARLTPDKETVTCNIVSYK